MNILLEIMKTMPLDAKINISHGIGSDVLEIEIVELGRTMGKAKREISTTVWPEAFDERNDRLEKLITQMINDFNKL